jgi:hypothetical protein
LNTELATLSYPSVSYRLGGTLLKSELLKAIQSEINRHGLDTFPVRVDNGNIVTPGCPACRKTLYTVDSFIDHIAITRSLGHSLFKIEHVNDP